MTNHYAYNLDLVIQINE